MNHHKLSYKVYPEGTKVLYDIQDEYGKTERYHEFILGDVCFAEVYPPIKNHPAIDNVCYFPKNPIHGEIELVWNSKIVKEL